MEKVEIKITVRNDQEAEARRVLALRPDEAQRRDLWFFDTHDLHLFAAKGLLRARVVRGGKDDSTVKIRPVEPALVPVAWKRVDGFRLEVDSVGDRMLHSASLTVTRNRSEIEDVARGRRSVAALFSLDQERLLREFCPTTPPLGDLLALGPVAVRRWEIARAGLGHPLTVEEWQLAEGDQVLEVSVRVDPDETEAARKDLARHLRENGLDPGGVQETKTKRALESLVLRA